VPQPMLADGVVVLTPWRLADAPVLVRFDLDPELQRWFDFPTDPVEPAEHLARAQEVIRRWWQGYDERTTFAFAVRLDAEGEAIGSAELQANAIDRAQAMISYATLPEHRGKGLASRAARLLAVAGLERFGFRRVELLADLENVASQRVAERAGFTREGVRRATGWFEHHVRFAGVPRDSVSYSLVVADLEPAPE